MQLIFRTLANVLSRRPQLAGAFEHALREEEDALEVVHFLARYRAYKREREAIIVETPLPLDERDKDSIRLSLGVGVETQLIEKLNPALVNSLQIIYQGRVYSFRNDNRLERLKGFFIYS